MSPDRAVGSGRPVRWLVRRPAERDHVTGDHRPDPPPPPRPGGPRALSRRRSPRGSVRPDRPGPGSPRWRSGTGNRRPAGRRPASVPRSSTRGSRAASSDSSSSARSTGRPACWRSDVADPTSSAGRSPSSAGQFTLIPIPTTIGGRAATAARSGRPDRPRPVRRPASDRRRQQVVRPLDRPDVQPRPPPAMASAAARATTVPARWRWSGAARSGRSSTDNNRLAPAGASQRRPSRPRPAVWWSATATTPSAAPGPGLVEQVPVGRVDRRRSAGCR